MIVGVGTDIVNNLRVGRLYREFGRKFLGKYLTEREIDSLKLTSSEHLGGLFALKEAVVKCLSAISIAVDYHSVEVFYLNKSPRPMIRLVNDSLSKNGHFEIHATIAHEKNYSVAFAVIEKIVK